MDKPVNHLTEIRKQLEKELLERAERAERIDNRLSQPGLQDWEEQATQRENDEVLETLGNQAVKEIEQIKHALHCIDNGTYGICAHCGSPIPPERLKAMPYATNCMHCV